MGYRYLLTPHGGLELNYQYNQNVQHFVTNTLNNSVHDRSGDLRRLCPELQFKNFNPFIEGGAAGFMFSPIDDAKTNTFGISRNTNRDRVWRGDRL